MGSEPDPRRGRRVFGRARGFTLVELMIAVAIIGLLTAVAVPAFSRFARRARTVEASLNLQRLTQASAAYYYAEHADGNGAILPRQFPVASAGLPGQGGWTPSISGCSCKVGGKCLPDPTWWANDPAWAALNFGLDDPFTYGYQYYSYALYAPPPNGSNVGDFVKIYAYANLSCDGVHFGGFQQIIRVKSDWSLQKSALFHINDLY